MMSSQRQVLFISYLFPPTGGPGVQRSAKFVKYLPCFGWEPVVLTTYRQTRPQRDESLLLDIPPETAVIRTGTGEPTPGSHPLHRFIVSCLHTPLSIPDLGNLWLPWVLPAALRELQRRPIRAIYATGDPFSSHILGAILKVRTKLPLVLDYRDEWTLDPVYRASQSRHRARFQFIERGQQRCVIDKADRVVVVTDSARNAFVEEYGAAHKFLTIRNGYDTEDFETAVDPNLSRANFHIVYTGHTLDLIYRPDTFLGGLRQGLDRSPALRASLRVSFVGNLDHESRATIQRLNLEPWVRVVGYVPHAQSVGYLRHADLLLLIARRIPSRMTGKVYEYIGSGKPVLVLANPDAEAVQLLTKAGTAVWVDPEDPSAIGGKLIELEDLWRRGTLRVEPNQAFIQTHTRKALAGYLAQVLDDISSELPVPRRRETLG
jgi:glycosyltransferase involved in cell wall biosynthesis